MNIKDLTKCPECGGAGCKEVEDYLIDCDCCIGTGINPELPKVFEIVLSRLYDSIEVLDNLLNHKDRLFAMGYFEDRLSDHKHFLKSLEDLQG